MCLTGAVVVFWSQTQEVVLFVVHECPPLSLSGLPSNGRQTRMGLVTDVRSFHLSLNALQMAAPRAAIWFPPSNAVGTCVVTAHVCPT